MTLRSFALSAAVSALAMATTACSYGAADGVEVVSQPLASVEMVQPPPRDPSELQVLFWNDEERSARFREMVFGGMTDYMLNRARIPVIMLHS